MEPFSVHRGIVATIDRANVDTDAIIPKQFLKSIERTGFGRWLFYDWRYAAGEQEDPGFILNREPWRGATILVARNNFGCGSSREHAVWAVQQFGFRAVIAPRRTNQGETIPAFADIFRNNAVKNGLLTVELGEPEVEQIFEWCRKEEGLEATVDLEQQEVRLHGADDEAVFPFEIDAGVRDILLQGLDDIDLTLQSAAAIRAFENRHDPQVYGRS